MKKYKCSSCENSFKSQSIYTCPCKKLCMSCSIDESTGKTCKKCEVKKKSHQKAQFICLNEGCGSFIAVNSYNTHLEQCKFKSIPDLVEEKNYNHIERTECDHCHQMVEYPDTKHLYVTNFKPSQCECFTGICPNCHEKDVIFVDHFKICEKIPIKCDLFNIGCTGWNLKDSEECSKNFQHYHLFTKTLFDIEKLKNDWEQQRDNFQTDIKDVKCLSVKLNKIRNYVVRHPCIYDAHRKGKLIWEIDNVIEFLDQNNQIISPTVYSHNRGYKVCLKAFPNIQNQQRSLSLYFVIMKGEYDELLQWPFNYVIKIKVLNKKNKKLSKFEIYQSNINKKCFQKPVSDFNIGCGNPNFIEINDLIQNGFIEDDVLFIGLGIRKRTGILI